MSDHTHEAVPALSELGRALEALTALAATFPTLPSNTTALCRVLPPTGGPVLGISVDLHTTFADFEAWREALGIDPADIEHRRLDTFQTLRTCGAFHGVPVRVTAYTPNPAHIYALALAQAA